MSKFGLGAAEETCHNAMHEQGTRATMLATHCTQCATPRIDEAKHCGECGAVFRVITKVEAANVYHCADCESVVQEGAKHCTHCGQRFRNIKRVADLHWLCACNGVIIQRDCYCGLCGTKAPQPRRDGSSAEVTAYFNR